MAELLFGSPSLWTDVEGNSPPASWDGTQYNIAQDTPETLTYNGPFNAGDTISFLAAWYDLGGQPIGASIAGNLSGGVNPINASVPDGTAGNVTASATYTLDGTEGDTAEGGNPGVIVVKAGYAGEYTFAATLTLPTLAAPDLTMTVGSGSSGNTITPVLTYGGAPAAGTIRLIVPSYEQPSHGSATPADFSTYDTFLTYNSTAGFLGTDTFHYYGYVNSAPTNLATVTVTVVPGGFWTDFVASIEII